jgi:hypothetical protein
MNFRFLLSALLFLTVLASCKTNQRDGLANHVGKFISNNDQVNFILKVNINSLLEKTAILDLPDFGFELKETYDQLNKGAALSEQIYVIGAGPLSKDGIPEELYLFMAVEDTEELAELMTDMGYFFEKEGAYHIHEESGLSLGYNDNFMIAVLAETNTKISLLKAFERVKNNKVEDQLLAGLDRTGDLLFSMNLENLYGTSNTDLNKLPIQQQERIKTLVKGSFVNTVIEFNAGEIVIETHLDFNQELENAMFFAESGSANALQYVGPGEPLMAMSMNLNIEKMEDLFMSSYPEIMKELYSNMGPQGLLLKAIGGGKLAAFINGEFALALTGFEEVEKDQTPQINFYAGLGKSSGDIIELIQAFADEAGATLEKEGLLRYEEYLIKLMNHGIIMSNNASMIPEALGKTPLEIPSDLKELLSHPLALYINFKELANEDADEYLRDASFALDYLEKLSFYADHKKARLVITFENKQDNVLKQSVDIALDSF